MNNNYKLNLGKYSTHSIIAKYIDKKKVVLDVGCNEGYLGNIADKSNVFYGLDYSLSAVKVAKQKYNKAEFYDLNNLEKLNWNVKFDSIIFADVLEHVLNPNVVLDYFVANYLKIGGNVIVSLPNIANWQIRLNLLFGKFDYTETGILDKTHLHLYTYKSAIQLVKSSNLKIVKVLYGSSIFGPILQLIPAFRSFLSTNIILIATK